MLIHDAARPCLSEALITACIGALDGHDGVLPVLPMKDTVYLSRDGRKMRVVFAQQTGDFCRTGAGTVCFRKIL